MPRIELTEGIEQHIEPASLPGQSAGGVVVNLLRAQRADELQIRRAGTGRYLRADAARVLHGKATHPAGTRTDEHMLAGF